MSGISVIGLGAMGSALARALVKAGHEVTVWNRSPQKMEPLVDLGADGAESGKRHFSAQKNPSNALVAIFAISGRTLARRPPSTWQNFHMTSASM